MMNAQEISLRYNDSIVIDGGEDGDVSDEVMSFCNETMNYGYILSGDLIHRLSGLSSKQLASIYKQTINALSALKGNDVLYKPMYPNFPKQVKKMDEVELYTNAIFHYLSDGQWLPEYKKKNRKRSLDAVKYKVIQLSSPEEFNNIYTRLVSSVDSISSTDVETIKWFINNHNGLDINVKPTHKEIMAIVLGETMKYDIASVDASSMTTVNDILRLATYLSDGDVSLGTNTVFRSLPRSIRRRLAYMLNDVCNNNKNAGEDFQRHSGKWVRLFHSLHIGEYIKHWSGLKQMVNAVRDGHKKFQTFNSKIERYFDNGQYNRAVQLLETRPSEFARRIDKILRETNDQEYVLEAFGNVVDQVSTRVLVQLLGHLKSRSNQSSFRMIVTKNNPRKPLKVDNPRKGISKKVIETLRTMIQHDLHKRFSALAPLGKVWIDERLKNCPVPTAIRGSSEGLHQLARGTRLPMDDKNTLRFFIYWVGRDIDLSATFHDESYEMVEQVSYTDLKSSRFKAYHSGDVVEAPDGASEFIDIDIPSAVANGARYVVMNVYVYRGPAFKDHDVCYAGWMSRSKPNSNAVYDPKHVKQRIDVQSGSRNTIPVIFDLVTKEAIMMDADFSKTSHYSNNVHSNVVNVTEMLQNVVESKNKMSLYRLFKLHANARGELVDDMTSADITFGVDDNNVTPYNINVINSEYMS